MRTHRAAAEEWGAAYKAASRSSAGPAMATACEVFEAVARGAEAGAEVKHKQLEILAGAILELRASAVAEVRSEILAQARALVAGSVRIAHTELERLAAEILAGGRFT